MGLSRAVSEINGDFGRKSQIFPTLCILRPRWRRRKIRIGTGAGGQKTSDGRGYRAEFDDIFSCVDTIHQGTNVTERRKDRHRTRAKTALAHAQRHAVKMKMS